MPSLVMAPIFWGQDNLSHCGMTSGLTGTSFAGNPKAPVDVGRQSWTANYQEQAGLSSDTPCVGKPFQTPAVKDPVDIGQQSKGPPSQ